jgi:TetR/AcrR family transcriptional regulator, regulator of cefoperazone and chloramphenicol sensitivity
MFKRPFEFGIGMPRAAKVSRVSQATREKIIKAASRAFARDGYEGASVRTIVIDAQVNQAAINYHFGSKEGLYRAVLHAALRALMSEDAPQSGSTLPREAALRRFVRRQLRPMTARDELSDYVRIFGWETLKSSAVFRKFMAREAAPFFAAATNLVRRFLPDNATDRQAVVAALWLLGQCNVFVRNAERLANPPLRLKVDERFVDGLADTIATWAANGLGRLPTKARS